MPKFSGSQVRTARPTGPVTTTDERLPTHEGGRGWSRTPESELFILAACNMVGENTFYEDAQSRDTRFADLVRAVAKSNPEFIAGAAERVGLAQYLRSTLQMRSASMVMACEYIAAGAANGRSLINRVIQRGDEPAEALGYWLSVHGRKIPMPLKRGIADASVRLYNERNALRYDGLSRGIRMADVIELVHPRPSASWQSALFKYLLDKRHHSESTSIDPQLEGILLDERLRAIPEAGRRVALREGLVAQAGWSWERLSGWLPGGMDAEAWEGVIPQMGYMACLRNLRNFDEAGVSAATKEVIRKKLADPAEVAASRQFPYRFWSAFKFAPSLEWGSVLEGALDLSVGNIPELTGRTLVLIDTSGSMQHPVSEKSRVQRFEIGGLFAAALAKRCETVDVAIFGYDSAALPVRRSESVLRYVEKVGAAIGSVGHATYVHEAIRKQYDNHDRVVIFTDEQAHDNYMGMPIPAIHVFNLAGYRAATVPSGPGRYTYSGFTDAMFTVMKLLDDGRDGAWPW